MFVFFFFRYDFELFNYSMDGYTDIGMPDKEPPTLLDTIMLKDIRSNPKINAPDMY